ncbi:NAD(P)-dependent oxidoreductase [candidate division KSB1 bacterium]|nr:NAD(P)-dependent oxidoreductase [candidate division KSB1 bacterium]
MKNATAQKSDRKNILILGGSGFLGSAFARHCQERGKQVQVLLHRRAMPADLQPSQVFYGSLQSFNWNMLKEHPPQVIYHFARIPGRGSLGRKVAAYLSAFANRRLLRWLARQPQPPLLVLVAGTLAYGSIPDREITEDEPLHPVSFARPYHIGEKPIVEAQHVPRQIMRISWAYGDGSWFRSFYLRPMREQGHIPLYGGGENWMSLIHTADAAGMIDFLSTHGPAGQTFNLFCGPAIQQKQLVKILQQLTGYPVQKVSLEKLRGLDKAVAEAFAFSLRVGTKHRALYKGYRYLYSDIAAGLKSVMNNGDFS